MEGRGGGGVDGRRHGGGDALGGGFSLVEAVVALLGVGRGHGGCAGRGWLGSRGGGVGAADGDGRGRVASAWRWGVDGAELARGEGERRAEAVGGGHEESEAVA